MKSKAKIEKHLKKKTNSELVETLIAAKKNNGWQEVAGILSGPRRKRIGINLSDIEEKAKEGELVVVPGKILSMGELKKKVRIVALGFSFGAKEKLLKSKHETSTVLEEIKKNPEAKGVKILK
jgi:large subunit ribosomal protein L18e